MSAGATSTCTTDPMFALPGDCSSSTVDWQKSIDGKLRGHSSPVYGRWIPLNCLLRMDGDLLLHCASPSLETIKYPETYLKNIGNASRSAMRPCDSLTLFSDGELISDYLDGHESEHRAQIQYRSIIRPCSQKAGMEGSQIAYPSKVSFQLPNTCPPIPPI